MPVSFWHVSVLACVELHCTRRYTNTRLYRRPLCADLFAAASAKSAARQRASYATKPPAAAASAAAAESAASKSAAAESAASMKYNKAEMQHCACDV